MLQMPESLLLQRNSIIAQGRTKSNNYFLKAAWGGRFRVPFYIIEKFPKFQPGCRVYSQIFWATRT
jgi:hypothetical protein